MHIDNPLGLYSFLGLAVLVLVYLIRPRPVDINIPSIMFIMRDKGHTRENRFFKTFMRNLLFLLQFIALALLASAVSSPLINMAYDTTAGHTVILLDMSASMQAKDGSLASPLASTRFDEALSTAKKAVKGSTTLILAENIPMVALEEGSESKAQSILASLKPRETRSNIGDAIMLAGDILKTNEGRVVVISDFVFTEGMDPEVAKAAIEARGIVVDFVKVGEKLDNIGIIGLKIDSKKTIVDVKNYYGHDQKITLEIEDEKGEKETIQEKILANSIEKFEFGTKGGLTKIRVLIQDNFMADNIAYISNPQKGKIKTLLITDKENIFLKNALLASDAVDVTIVEPIVVPEVKDYQVIIFDNFNNKKLLPGAMSDIAEHVKKGAAVVITYQDDLTAVDFNGMLSIKLGNIKSEAKVYPKVDNLFTRNVDFGITDEYFEASADNDTIVVAAAEDNSPIIAIKEIGDGKVVYYGINDGGSGFKNSPSYPVFWNYLMSYLVGVENINNFNHKTGQLLSFENQKQITTPEGRLAADRLIMDKAGVYIIDGMQHTANIINEAESRLFIDKKIQGKKSEKYAPQKVVRRKDVNVEIYLLAAAFLIVVAEMFFVKFRGDL